MKLRNKKTGENYETTMPIVFNIKTSGGGEHTVSCESITELNEEWEDVPEEPKEHWAIDQFGEPINVSGLSKLQLEKLHRLGNDFPSENATMKSIEKLKAWKRLKDKGFRFTGLKKIYQGRSSSPINYTESPAYISFNKATEDFVSPTGDWVKENWDDLYLLFGGEE